MSRVGRKPIVLPKGVETKLMDGLISVKGPKGLLTQPLTHPEISVAVEGDHIVVKRSNDEGKTCALHGMMRNLIANMVRGVTEGFTKELEMQGVGFKADVQGKNLQLSIGFSHPVLFPIPEGIQIKVTNQTKIQILGADKQTVGQTAAEIRALKQPEPYQGKGIRYLGENVRRKAGKTAATGSAGKA